MGLLDSLKKQALNKMNELTNNVLQNVNENTTEEQVVNNTQKERHPSSVMPQPTKQTVQQEVIPQSPQTHSDNLQETPSQFHGLAQSQRVTNQPQSPQKQDTSTTNTQIYDSKIEGLIEMALADGELTEKEKQVLFKKAEAQGIDLDEFEMVLDAKLYEKRRGMQIAVDNAHESAPNSNKYGDIKKCPNCGAIIESFTVKCPDCGYEFRNIGTNDSIQILFKKLEKIENDHFNVSFWSDKDEEQIKRDKKIEIISNFPIPTTKDNLLEFLSMGIPLAKKIGNFFTSSDPENEAHNSMVKAWRSKCEQVIMKARFSMKEDKETLEEIEYYAQEIGLNKQ